jgi:hypothetical protein
MQLLNLCAVLNFVQLSNELNSAAADICPPPVSSSPSVRTRKKSTGTFLYHAHRSKEQLPFHPAPKIAFTRHQARFPPPLFCNEK